MTVRILLEDNNLDPRLLDSLLDETLVSIKSNNTKSLQTGPAIRGDEKTLSIHRDLLKSNPKLLAIYNLLSKSIQDSASE